MLLLLLVHLFGLLQHGVHFFLLRIVQQSTSLGNGGFAQAVKLLDLPFAGKRTVIDDRHRLLTLVLKHILHLGLLVRSEIQLLCEHSDLIVDRRPARLRLRLLLRRLSSLRLARLVSGRGALPRLHRTL